MQRPLSWFRVGLTTLVVCVTTALCAGDASAQCTYDLVGIMRGPECPGGGPMNATVLEMNDHGQAVGYVEDCDDPFIKHPFVWTEETGVIVLPLPPGAIRGEAVAINNIEGSDGLGAIAVNATLIGFEGDRAYVYDDGLWTIVPPQSGFTFSAARSINDAGQVAGSRMTENGLVGYCWQNGAFIDLFGPAVGQSMLALDVNAAGHITGELIDRPHAAFWDGESVMDLGTIFGGASAFANALNNAGTITGGAMVFDRRLRISRLHAFVDTGSGVAAVNIGVPKSFESSMGIDINDAGQVIVRCFTFVPTFASHTFLWQHGDLTPTDALVGALPDGVTLDDAEAINNAGEFVANGVEDGAKVGLLFAPVDVPVADLDFNCAVDVFDLFAMLDSWGPCAEGDPCPGDIVSSASFAPPGDGIVNAADLAFLLGSWTGGGN